MVFEFDSLPDGKADEEIINKFENFISDDLDTPKSLALLHDSFGSKKGKETIEKMDKVLGLYIEKLSKEIKENIPEEILELKRERDEVRQEKNWQKSDELREEIEKESYVLEDGDNESVIKKKLSSLI